MSILDLNPELWCRTDVANQVTSATAPGRVSAWNDLSGKNHPLLQAVGANQPYFLEHSGSNSLWLPGVAGNYARTPSTPANQITGRVILIGRISIPDATPAATAPIVSNQSNRYMLRVNVTGGLIFTWFDGVTQLSHSSLFAIPDSSVSPIWVKSDFSPNNGSGGSTTDFSWSSDYNPSSLSGTWTSLGPATSAGVSQIAGYVFSSLDVGVSQAGPIMAGSIYRVQVLTSPNTLVVDFNPNDAPYDQATSFTSSTTGEVWTINSALPLRAQIVGRSSILFDGVANFLSSIFPLIQPDSYVALVKQVSWTDQDTIVGGSTVNSQVLQNGASPALGMFSGTGVAPINSQFSIDTYGVLSAIFNGAASSLGVNLSTPVVGDPGLAGSNGVMLGAKNGGLSNFSNIQVLELAVFPTALTSGQIYEVVSDMLARNGLGVSVPGVAAFPTCIDAATGRLRIRDSTPIPTDGWNHGIAIEPVSPFVRVGMTGPYLFSVNGLPIMALDKLFISLGAVTHYLAGWAFAADGSMVYDTAGAIAGYNQGVPQTSSGALAVIIA